VTSALARAAKTKDPKAQLTALLVAWRELRHPRIAELIDRLDAKLLASVKPITAKSMQARAEALITAAQSKDPVELGRVLISEWPKEWQAALPVLKAVCEAPDDPRVAKKLASIIDAAAHQSRGSRSFWSITFARIDELGDVRQLGLLEAQLTRSKSSYYREHSQLREQRSVERHRALEIAPLSSADEKLLEELEAPFAATTGVEKVRRRSGEELLAAVWDAPQDAGLRAVYGDWLVEQGDPRGELISLQLGAPSPKATRKIEALVEKHWKKWLGPIADWFKSPPRFELGFPAFGYVSRPSAREGREQLLPLLSRPEWSTFTDLGMPWDAVAPHELGPRFRGLTSLRSLEPKHITPLAQQNPTLTAISFYGGDEEDELPAKTWDRFSHLERITTSLHVMRAVLSGFGSRPLKTLELEISGEAPMDEWWPQFDRAPIEEIVMRSYESRVRVSRVKPGAPFTRVHALTRPRLERLGLAFPPGMTHLTCEPGEPIEASSEVLARFEEQLARYKKLEVRELPFTLEPLYLSLRIQDGSYSDENIPKLWEVAREHLGVSFDEGQIGYSGKPRPLGADPVATLQKLARARRDSWLSLSKSGADARLRVSRDAMEATIPVTSAEHCFEAIQALLTFGGTKVSLGKERYSREEFPASTFARKKAEVLALIKSLMK
jgi:uncharacterized protein (TIGR02996 family)